MITKNQETKNGFQIYQDLLVYILTNLDELVDTFYQDTFSPLLKQIQEMDNLLTFKDNILEVRKEKIFDDDFMEVLTSKTRTEYITHIGSPDAKILTLLRNTIPDFDEEDFDNTLSFDVKDKKLVLYNFTEVASSYKNGFKLTEYPFSLGDDFTEQLKQKVADGEYCLYPSITVLVVKNYAGIISDEGVKEELKKKITDIIKWATIVHSTVEHKIPTEEAIYYLPMILNVSEKERMSELKYYYQDFIINKTNLYSERVNFIFLNDLFHFTKEELTSVFDKEILKEKPFFLNCLE